MSTTHRVRFKTESGIGLKPDLMRSSRTLEDESRAWRTSKGTSGVDGLRKYGALPSIAVQGKPSVKASKRETGEMLIRPSQAGWMLGIDPEIELLRYFASLTLSSK